MRPGQKFSSDKYASEALQQFLDKLSVRANLSNTITFNHPKRPPMQEMYAVLVKDTLTPHQDLLQSLKKLDVVDEVTIVLWHAEKTTQIIGVDTKKLAEVEQTASLLKVLKQNGIIEAPYKSGFGPGLWLPPTNVYFFDANTDYHFTKKALEYLSKGNSVKLIQRQRDEIEDRGAVRSPHWV